MPYDAVLQKIAREIRPYIGRGKVADYIPALAAVPADQFGIAVHTIDGQSFAAGDADQLFSIQSISKVLTLTMALADRGERLWRRVGKEPSGDPFNSLVQLEYEHGVPRNPLINPGAIVIADCLVSDRRQPKRELLDFVRRLAGDRSIQFDRSVARSERDTGSRNLALANLMRSFGHLENDIDRVLDCYFHQCSLAMSCRQLARAFAFLANSGIDPHRERVVSARRARRVNALMLTCGTYDRAGEFAFEVGLPAKSGVGGGIVAVVPGKLCVCVWSPALGPSGNSVAGVEALKRFVKHTSLSIF